MRARDRETEALWDRMAAEMPDAMTACWDHLAHQPLRDLGDKCHEMVGKAAGTWQYKVRTTDYRVWYRVRADEVYVIVTKVSFEHPKRYPGGGALR